MKKGLMKASNKQDKFYSNFEDLLEHEIFKMKRFEMQIDSIEVAVNNVLFEHIDKLRAKTKKLIYADISEL
jgi:hypothetical protein